MEKYHIHGIIQFEFRIHHLKNIIHIKNIRVLHIQI